jgi:hypothetical protein
MSDSETESKTTTSFFEFIGKMIDTKEWNTLTRYPRINGVKVEMKEGHFECKNGCHYENGIIIDKTNTGYSIEEITYENDSVKISSSFQLDNDGELLNGYVNCFGLGYIDIDQGYVSGLFEGFIYNKELNKELKKDWKWDTVE